MRRNPPFKTNIPILKPSAAKMMLPPFEDDQDRDTQYTPFAESAEQ
jgi:hypothetical protein